jgi:hypothetical protein
MKGDKKGVSTCNPGKEKFEKATSHKKLVYLAYEYRHTDGQLFTTAAPNLFTARDRRDKWLKKLRGSKAIASNSAKDLMQQACEEIKQLTQDRNYFFDALKKVFNAYEGEYTLSAQVFSDISNKIEEYENRPQCASSCKKSG